MEAFKAGHQAMVFVHSRKDTGKTARTLGTKAQSAGQLALFDCKEHLRYALAAKDIAKSRNKCGLPALNVPAAESLEEEYGRVCMCTCLLVIFETSCPSQV